MMPVLPQNAEAVACHTAVIGDKDGAIRVLKQFFQGGSIVFAGAFPEDVGADIVVDAAHLPQQSQYPGDIL